MIIHGKGYGGEDVTDCGLDIKGKQWGHPGDITCQGCLKAEREYGIKRIADAISEWDLSEEELAEAIKLSKIQRVMDV